MDLKIGCTGWSYEGWSGTFYPKIMQQANWLKFYSRVFNITEINSTYYRIPSLQMSKKWAYDTPNNFEFTAKFPGLITHEKQLIDVKQETQEFLAALAPLRKKIFALVLQLPPSLSFDLAKKRLEELFSYLPNYYKYPIEGRHDSWFNKEAISYLTENDHCLIWNEVSGIDNPAPITTDYIYLRLIGDRSIDEFGKVVRSQEDLINKWASILKLAQTKVNQAIIMSNNHFEGFAPATANSFALKLGLPELRWEDKTQRKLGDF